MKIVLTDYTGQFIKARFVKELSHRYELTENENEATEYVYYHVGSLCWCRLEDLRDIYAGTKIKVNLI